MCEDIDLPSYVGTCTCTRYLVPGTLSRLEVTHSTEADGGKSNRADRAKMRKKIARHLAPWGGSHIQARDGHPLIQATYSYSRVVHIPRKQ